MSGKLNLDEIWGRAQRDTVRIPTGTGNLDEYIQDLFTGRKALNIYPAALFITEQWVDAQAYGTLGAQATIEAAIADIGSDTRMLLLNPGTWNITTSLTIPRNITLWPLPGAFINVTSGQVFIVGHMVAGGHKVFTDSGYIYINEPARAEWFGVNISETAENNTSMMNRAVACSSVVSLTATGTYYADDVVWMWTIPGCDLYIGPLVTWDLTNYTGTGSWRSAFISWMSAYGSTNLSSSVAAGATSIDVGSLTGMYDTCMVHIYHDTYRGVDDWSIINSSSGTTITLEYPLSYAWDTSVGTIKVDCFAPWFSNRIYGGGRIIDTDAAANSRLVYGVGDNNFRVENMWLELSSSTGNLGRVIEVSEANYITAKGHIRDNFIHGNANMGVHLDEGAFGVEVSRNHIITDGGAGSCGVYAKGTKNTIKENIINKAAEGISVYTCRDLKILENDISNCTKAIALNMTSYVNDVLVRGNTGKNCTTGLYIDGDATKSSAQGIIIQPNNFRECTVPYNIGAGIGFDNYEPGVRVTPGGYPCIQNFFPDVPAAWTDPYAKTEQARFFVKGGQIPADGGFRVHLRGYVTVGAWNVYLDLEQPASTSLFTGDVYQTAYGNNLIIDWYIRNEASTTSQNCFADLQLIGNYNTVFRWDNTNFNSLDTDDDFEIVLSTHLGAGGTLTVYDLSLHPIGLTP